MFALGFIITLEHSGSYKDRPRVACTVVPDRIPDTKALDRGFNLKNRGLHNILQCEKEPGACHAPGVYLEAELRLR